MEIVGNDVELLVGHLSGRHLPFHPRPRALAPLIRLRAGDGANQIDGPEIRRVARGIEQCIYVLLFRISRQRCVLKTVVPNPAHESPCVDLGQPGNALPGEPTVERRLRTPATRRPGQLANDEAR